MNFLCPNCNNEFAIINGETKHEEYTCLNCRDSLRVRPNIRINESDDLVYYYLPFRINDVVYMIRGNTIPADEHHIHNDTTYILKLEDVLVSLEQESYLYIGPFFKPNLDNINQELYNFVERILKLKYFI